MIWVTRILFLFLVLASFITFFPRIGSKRAKNEVSDSPLNVKKCSKAAFVISKHAYDNLGEGLLGSKSHRYKKVLEESLKFLGANTRPDYPAATTFFSYKGRALVFNEKESYPLKLISEGDLEGSENHFFEVESKKNKLEFKLFEGGVLSFNLSLPLEVAITPTQIGGYKLDNYLLVRQQVSWLGKDLFLIDNGGEDYEAIRESERLDFMHVNPGYYLFAKKGDLFTWKEGRWQKAMGDSKKYPLMAVEKVDAQIMEMNVWDVSGRQKEKILLSKSRASSISKMLSPLKFIGAKSSRKWLFKADKMRLSLEPGDWLINHGHKWEKINSIEAIDQYVTQLNMGELFIVEELTEQNGKKILKGNLYNLSRTEKIDYALDVSSGPKGKEGLKK